MAKCNILFSPLEGEKKFLGELCELRNFREGYKKYKTLDRATGCAMTDVGEKKGKIKMNKNNLLPKQPNNPVASPETNHSPLTIHHSPKRIAFTLAEVLITLGIIGVVFAIIMPTIISDIQDKQYSVARKKALATIGEAGRQIAVSGEIGNAVDAEDFVENYLKRQLKMVKTCKNDDLRTCGIETDTNKILSFHKAKRTMPRKWIDLAWGVSANGAIDTTAKSYGFVSADGFAVNLFYNKNCQAATEGLIGYPMAPKVCMFAIYDMNGLRKPNQVGKDIGFVSVFFPTERSIAIAPEVYKTEVANAIFEDAQEICANLDGATLPNIYELTSLYLSGYLHDMVSNGDNWSSTTGVYPNGDKCARTIHFNWSYSSCQRVKSGTRAVSCVKR